MNKKLAPFLLIGLLAVLVIVLRRCTETQRKDNSYERTTGENNSRQRGFNRDRNALEYTAHARCRMDCRKVSTGDVLEIMTEGKVNYRKSDLQDKPCATYAVEGYTEDREHLRIVFAQCATKTKVVTCINLDEDFACDCPGDEKGKK